MYTAIGLRPIIYVLVALGVMTYLGLLIALDFGSLLRPIGPTFTVVAVIATIAGTRPVFWRLVAIMEWVGMDVFPNINGTWQGEVRSNKGMMLEVVDAAGKSDLSVDALGRKFHWEPDLITLRIHANLFGITVRARTDRARFTAITVVRSALGRCGFCVAATMLSLAPDAPPQERRNTVILDFIKRRRLFKRQKRHGPCKMYNHCVRRALVISSSDCSPKLNNSG